MKTTEIVSNINAVTCQKVLSTQVWALPLRQRAKGAERVFAEKRMGTACLEQAVYLTDK